MNRSPVVAVESARRARRARSRALLATLAFVAVASPMSSPPSAIRDVLPGLVDFVERERGLTFGKEVAVVLLDDAAFEERLLATEETAADIEATRGLDATFTALGLIEPHVDLAVEFDELLAGGTLGYYYPQTDELLVRGTQATPAVRAMVVHELTHALQDQAFDLDRPELDDRDDESSLGFTALVEGDAQRVEEAYLASLPPAEEDAARSELDGGTTPDVPDILLSLLFFSYDVGPDLVAQILDAGGQDALDDAFDDPPTTSEQMIFPASYLAGQPALDVTTPVADGPQVDAGTLGQVGLILLLASAIDEEEAINAAVGWGGDRYVTWQDGPMDCTRFVVRMDDPYLGQDVRRALSEWADNARVDASVVAHDEETQVTSCA